MPSGWNVYYVVFLSAVLALAIPATLALVSLMIARGRKKSSVAKSPGERTIVGSRINVRFFSAANAAMILIILALVLVPCAGIIRNGTNQVAILRGLLAIVSVAVFAALGLLYSARKGDLGWLNTFQVETPGEPSSENQV